MTVSASRQPDRLLSVLSRQKWVLLGCVGLAVAGSYAASFFMPPLYEASARVMVPPSRYSAPGVGTEAETIRSSDMAETVIRTLNLAADPELAGQGAKSTGGFLSLSVNTPAEIPRAVIQRFQHKLTVSPVDRSYVLVITYASGDADKSASVANAVAEEYVRRQTPPPPEPVLPPANLDRLENLLTQKAVLAQRYGPRHPRMIALEKDLADARAALALPAPAPAASSDAAKIVALATPPLAARQQAPSWLYLLALLTGLLIGVLLAILNDKFDKGFRSRRALETATGLPVHAVIPVPKDAAALDSQGSLVLQKPSGETAEAIRALRAGLKLLGEKEGRKIKVVTLTSSRDTPQESRSRALTGLWLGRLAARAGENVLVVDADLRNPLLHSLVGRSNTPSLVDYLAGQTYLEQVLWKQDVSGAHLIFGSSVPNTALDLIGSEKMKKLSGYLRQSYDLVIYCAPPCLPSADAAVLANESDQTVYVVTEGQTPRAAVASGLKIFEGFGYNAVSLVLASLKK